MKKNFGFLAVLPFFLFGCSSKVPEACPAVARLITKDHEGKIAVKEETFSFVYTEDGSQNPLSFLLTETVPFFDPEGRQIPGDYRSQDLSDGEKMRGTFGIGAVGVCEGDVPTYFASPSLLALSFEKTD
jgi:hypothetical protein